MPLSTHNLRIAAFEPLAAPRALRAELALSERAAQTVTAGRDAVQAALAGEDPRLLVVTGPCSIHDVAGALDYARRLAELKKQVERELLLVMRVYFEKPRTTVGWKGLINDPGLDGSFAIDKGVRLARSLLLEIANLGLPAGCEFLDMTTPQYIADLVAWAAIGARTTESQGHRELASGLSCPVGFKNGTGGNVKIAVDAVRSASQPHHFLAVTKDGRSAIASTSGNDDCHVILRGGKAPNYDATHVDAAAGEMANAGLMPRLMIDASHANSAKVPENQPAVVGDIAGQVAGGERRIVGAMVESNLVAGRQNQVPGKALIYGQSITDGCIGWDTSVEVLETLADAVEARRQTRQRSVRDAAAATAL